MAEIRTVTMLKGKRGESPAPGRASIIIGKDLASSGQNRRRR